MSIHTDLTDFNRLVIMNIFNVLEKCRFKIGK